ncbi:hypothetical protein BDV09DRAFT_205769 [Aspergillus tetrazonus]
MEQQIMHIESELQREYETADWSTTFRAGPDSVGLLADCIVITSRPRVSSIELKGCGLEYTTLGANVIHCADVGAEAFLTTARNMKLLAQLTNELSQPNGVVRCPFNLCYCQLIGTWKQKQDVEIEIEKNQVAKELKENQTGKEEVRWTRQKSSCKKLAERRKTTGSGLAESLAVTIASTSAVVTAGAGLAVGGTHDIRELEASKSTLEETLAQLSAESKSIDEVAQIVAMSFKKVTELQQLVRKFMDFLFEVNAIISRTAKRCQFVYEAVKDKEDLIDPLLKEVSIL